MELTCEGGFLIPRHCEERSDEAIHSFFMRRDGLLRYARNDGREAVSSPLPLLAFEERLECRYRFLGAHPFAEQMAFLVDPAGHVFRRQF